MDPNAQRARDAEWVRATLDGDQQAFGCLYDAWFDRVFALALGIVHDRETAADVAQDTFLSAWKNLGTLVDPDTFGGWLLRIARNASLNRQARESRSTPVDGEGMAVIERSTLGAEQRLARLDDPARLAGDAELVALVREAAAALGARDAEVLDLQLRYGLSPAEIGEVVGLNRNAANQLCHRIRARFATAVRARVLWNGSEPACEQLRAVLRSAGVERFDAEAVRLADRHADTCPACSERRELRLQPAAMFASLPLVAAPVALKAKAAAALEAAGVPMGGSAFGSGSGPGALPGRSRRAGRLALMAAAAVVVLIAAVVLLAERPHDGVVRTTEMAAAPTTADPTSSLAAEPVAPVGPTVRGAPDPTTADPGIEQPTHVEEPPGTAPPSLVVRFELVPSQVDRTSWPLAGVEPGSTPTLVWEVSGEAASRVVLAGPATDRTPGLAATDALAGSLPVCPFAYRAGSDRCDVSGDTATTYEYRLTVYGQGGEELATATAVLTVSRPIL
ncbi:sigma-70 family RNA polymerase sigma factor [Rhabdothermincola sediminis]|uniref:sigma-70 family RNA polymerase sigma factor n=1 Tax=Rhabdothermincola sediminis TaxID=2751370 RepID=UPI001AA096B9|nr:sigma-70 family RNA polymerase sigma factor [Rhabdothermincola sediminis]